MPIVIQHGISPFVSGLTAFRSGRAQAERATRERDIQTSLALGRLGSRGLDRGFAEASRNRRQQQGQENVLERMELGQEQRLEQQRDSILQRSIQEQMAKDQQIQALPPYQKIQYLTRQQHILNTLSDPEFQALPREEQQRTIQPMVQAQRIFLEANPPKPPPTIDDDVKNGQVRFYPEHGVVMYRDGKGGYQARRIAGDKADQFSLTEWEDLLETAEGDIFDELKQLEKDTKGTLDFVGGLSESDMKRIAKKRAMERVDAKIEKFLGARRRRRQTESVPQSADAIRKGQQQEQQQGQLAAQQALRTRVEAQAPPDPATQEVEQVFNRGSQELMGIVQNVQQAGGNPDRLETWSNPQLYKAKDAARDVLNSLRVLWPSMSQEQKMQVVDLLELATKLNKLEKPIEGA